MKRITNSEWDRNELIDSFEELKQFIQKVEKTLPKLDIDHQIVGSTYLANLKCAQSLLTESYETMVSGHDRDETGKTVFQANYLNIKDSIDANMIHLASIKDVYIDLQFHC